MTGTAISTSRSNLTIKYWLCLSLLASHWNQNTPKRKKSSTSESPEIEDFSELINRYRLFFLVSGVEFLHTTSSVHE